MKLCTSFSELLNHINAGEQSLALYNVHLTLPEVQQLADALKVNQSLQSLNLLGNNIGPEGAKDIAEALKVNKALKSLYLYGNNIGPEGAKDIADALKENKSLQSLDLGSNNIGDEGAKDIADALKMNKSLKSLKLLCNNIELLGAEALDNAILANKRILYACYKNLSLQADEELKRRREFIKELITKWKTKDRNAFTNYELAEFYNNLDAIKLLSDKKGKDYYSIDFPQVYAELCSRIYARWYIGPAFVSGFQQVYKNINPDKNLIKSIVSIWNTVLKVGDLKDSLIPSAGIKTEASAIALG